MKASFATLTRDNHVAVVTIDRPPANAIDKALVEEMGRIVEVLASDESIRAVVFTATGQFFVGGADIKMMKAHMGEGLPRFMEAYTVELQRVYDKIERLPKPSIAAVNGFAAGGGCELALACDFRFMTTGSARIGLPEAKLGILPGGGGLQRMPRLIGKAKALELIIEGRLLSAEEALEIGLVNKIFAPSELMAETMKYAKMLSGQATKAIGVIKRCIHEGMETHQQAALAFDIAAQDILFKTRDGIEGIDAFIQKRRPEFSGS